MLKQRTIQYPTRTVGIGLHSGYKVELVLRPAAPDTGIVFHRTDLKPEVSIAVGAEAIGETMLASTLVRDGVRISTIEHLMSACSGSVSTICMSTSMRKKFRSWTVPLLLLFFSCSRQA